MSIETKNVRISKRPLNILEALFSADWYLFGKTYPACKNSDRPLVVKHEFLNVDTSLFYKYDPSHVLKSENCVLY